jgi:hypothetical protein
MPMESYNCSIFLIDMRRQVSSRGWLRFFRSKDLRLNLGCKLNARDSIVHLGKIGAAVTDSYSTNPTSHILNLSLR